MTRNQLRQIIKETISEGGGQTQYGMTLAINLMNMNGFKDNAKTIQREAKKNES